MKVAIIGVGNMGSKYALLLQRHAIDGMQIIVQSQNPYGKEV